VRVLTLVILVTCEIEIRRATVQGQPHANVPISKVTRAKRTGGVAQAGERLLCKCKTLSSSPSTAITTITRPLQKKKKDRRNRKEKKKLR
jgi:hypothetical protein